MDIDGQGIELIKQFEGYRAYPYQDAAGLWTIGYGHLIKDSESFPHDLDINEATALLYQDAQIAVDAVNDLVSVSLTQNQFNALVSLVYNIGRGAFASSTLLRKLNAGDYQGAFNEFPRWNKAGGQVIAGLTNRRAAEARIFIA